MYAKHRFARGERPKSMILGWGSRAAAWVLAVRRPTAIPPKLEVRNEFKIIAPVAQLDRVLASEAKGHRFDSCRARHL